MRPWLGKAGGAAVAATVVTALSFTRPVELLERPVSDALLRLSALAPPALARGVPDVTLVAIDAASLRAHPAWPWPRDRYGALAEKLFEAGAAVVAFDIDLSTPREPAGDAALAAAIRARTGRVALAALRQRQLVAGVGELEVVSWPAGVFTQAGARPGHVVVPLDSDGVVRRAHGTTELGGERVASLPTVALELAGVAAPPTKETQHRIDFRRAHTPLPVLSFADALEGRFEREVVAGRIVLIGASAAEFQDLWTTPLGAARPGVWIQAVEYRTLAAAARGEATLAPAPRSLLFALAFGLACLARRADELSARRRVAFFACSAAATSAACLAALLYAALLLSPALLVVQLAGHYAAGLERVRRRLGLRLRERELSLVALHEISESSAHREDADGLEIGLSLLGRSVDAHAVALLRAAPDGALENARVDWLPRGELAAVDATLAAETLATRRLRLLDGAIPGRPGVPGRALYVPLLAGRLPVGVLVIESRSRKRLGDTELRTVATVASQLALTVRSQRLAEDLRATLGASVEAIASAVEARDGYTVLHCRRLALFSASLAHELALPAAEVEAIRLGALLHDVGKIGVRDQILLKPGGFTHAERLEMERHAEIGHRIVQPIAGLSATTLCCVRNHHERFDGAGYPDGLAGEEIPLAARIVAIVDVWDALSTARPYKPAYAQSQVHELLAKDRGAHFDPALVARFLRLLDEEGDEMLSLVAASAEPVP
jgi:putative nucleotidyltransferase with HDIG domain